MIKLTIILFAFLFILTSCSNPEDSKKIKELEKQVQENNLKEKEFIFNKNKECLELFDKKDTKNFTTDYSKINNTKDISQLIIKEFVGQIFYSKSLNTCLFTYETIIPKKENESISFSKTYKIIDLIVRKNIFSELIKEKYNYKFEEINISSFTDEENELINSIKEQGWNSKDAKEYLSKYRNNLSKEQRQINYENHFNNKLKWKIKNIAIKDFNSNIIYYSPEESKSKVIKKIRNYYYSKEIQNKQFEIDYNNSSIIKENDILFYNKIEKLKN